MDAIILAGGLGTRLRQTVPDIPKAMALINGRPFLTFLLNYLHRFGFKKVMLATGHLHHKIEEFIGRSYCGLAIEYSAEDEPLGTGGGIKLALSKTESETVLIMNGDTFYDVDVASLVTLHREKDAHLTLALKPMRDISRYGIVRFKGTRVTGFEEKQPVAHGHINGGIYVANRNLFDGFDFPEKFSFEEDFLKPHVSRGEIHCLVSDGYFIDIGVPDDYRRAQLELKAYE